ncbi:MAG TPA: hypothetical protein DIT01_02755 [Lentisphaeria bacterium]|nr:hypothetical protein [Lentisphaeria bacterium]|tara:strand:- start:46 stop:1983 length:1938 start_codon:yes stop_codon:yes gene_type:complete
MNPTSKRPEYLGLAGSALALALLLIAGGVSLFWAHSRIIETACLPLQVAFVFGLVAWWYARMRRYEATEQEDQERLRRDYDRNDLFDDQDEALKLAKETRRQFQKYFIPGFTFIFGGMVLLSVWGLLYRWSVIQKVSFERSPLDVAGLCLCMVFLCLLAGSYFNGLSREKGCHFLRPVAAWLLMTCAVYTVAVIVMLLEHFGVGTYDIQIGKVVAWVIFAFGVEMMINFVIEFYRPRGKKDELRPVYESRILYLFTEPGGIARNVAQSLDYQFGVAVSETWFYRFLERAALPCGLLLIILFFLLDSFVMIEANEMAVKERFGDPLDGVLEPGLHVKWPRPIETARIVPVKKIQKLELGLGDEKDGDQHGAAPPAPGMEERKAANPAKFIPWDKEHYDSERKFVVASRDMLGMGDDVPFNFTAASIPVYYQVRADAEGIREYLYNYEDPDDVFKKIASREVVKFLVSVDFIELLATKRLQAKSDLETRLQAALAAIKPPLGIELIYVGFSGVHPSIDVAPAFQEVIIAQEQKLTTILNAEREAITVRTLVAGTAAKRKNDAMADAYYKTKVAEAVVAKFKDQRTAYELAPSIYKLRSTLNVITESLDNKTIYLIQTKAKLIFELDFKEQIRPGLMDYDQYNPENKK